MTREEKLKKIYEVIADKTLSFGCRFIGHLGEEFYIDKYDEEKNGYYAKNEESSCYRTKKQLLEGKLIGHPIYIGDVLDWWIMDMNKRTGDERILKVMGLWIKKREPIDNQSDDCIDFVYSLIEGND